MKKTMQYRQGDVFLELVAEIPEKLKTIPATSGRLILARGESTGHHHSIKSGSSQLMSTPNGEMFLLVQEGDALLEHQEHAPINLPPGQYRVHIQREYSPEAIRNVQD